MIFLFPRWDMLVPWRVNLPTATGGCRIVEPSWHPCNAKDATYADASPRFGSRVSIDGCRLPLVGRLCRTPEFAGIVWNISFIIRTWICLQMHISFFLPMYWYIYICDMYIYMHEFMRYSVRIYAKKQLGLFLWLGCFRDSCWFWFNWPYPSIH